MTNAIKGKRVEEAAASFSSSCRRAAARDVASVLKSATANAENNHNLSAEDLVVADAQAEHGPRRSQALAAPGPGSGVPDPQAHDPHHHRRRRPGGLEWVTRFTRTASGWVSRAPGRRSGTRTRTTRTLLKEDISIRQLVINRLANASVSGVEIERGINHVTVTIHTAKPGIVIGKGGANVELLRQQVGALTKRKVKLEVKEIRQPELDAALVATNISQQLARRIAFKKAMKQAIQRTMKAGAKGVKIAVAGRLGGSEMAPPRVGQGRPNPARNASRRHQLRPGPRAHDLRSDRREGLDLPRRSPGREASPRDDRRRRPPFRRGC